MTKSIVMNTLTGAVTEYDNFAFQSITPDRAGSAVGLYSLGGDVDIDQPIVSSVMTGKVLWADMKKKFLDVIHFAIKGSGTGAMKVKTEANTYSYPLQIHAAGVSRGKPGRGIRENYLAFGYSNTDGADFQLDRIDVPAIASNNRKA